MLIMETTRCTHLLGSIFAKSVSSLQANTVGLSAPVTRFPWIEIGKDWSSGVHHRTTRAKGILHCGLNQIKAQVKIG